MFKVGDRVRLTRDHDVMGTINDCELSNIGIYHVKFDVISNSTKSKYSNMIWKMHSTLLEKIPDREEHKPLKDDVVNIPAVKNEDGKFKIGDRVKILSTIQEEGIILKIYSDCLGLNCYDVVTDNGVSHSLLSNHSLEHISKKTEAEQHKFNVGDPVRAPKFPDVTGTIADIENDCIDDSNRTHVHKLIEPSDDILPILPFTATHTDIAENNTTTNELRKRRRNHGTKPDDRDW